MAAARSKLVSNWRLPGWYCGGQSTSWAPRRAASRSVQAASARCGRASAHRSARPEAMMALAWSASKMAPTAMVGMPASLRTRSANGVWYMRPYTGFWSGLTRSEEHTSELQSHLNLVCRLLLEKKKTDDTNHSQRQLPPLAP